MDLDSQLVVLGRQNDLAKRRPEPFSALGPIQIVAGAKRQMQCRHLLAIEGRQFPRFRKGTLALSCVPRVQPFSR